MTYTFLQNYWWILISLLGGLLAFLMFVQGGNVFMAAKSLTPTQKRLVLNSTGRKWELTFTTLVTFGGVFFASFPLFYSTSFGGAYWVWVILLITFVFHAVSYEFQHKKSNLIGSKAFRVFLIINGILAPVIVGAAVGTFFTGSGFTVNKEAIIGQQARVISAWGSAWHGLEALKEPLCLSLGLALLFLDMILGALYLVNNINEDELKSKFRKAARILSLPFLVAFLIFITILMTKEGFAVDAEGKVFMEKYKYLHNFMDMPLVSLMLTAGSILVLYGLFVGGFTKSRKGIWFAGPGAVLAVMAVFLLAGLNGTAYYPSSVDLQSSLTIKNSSSSFFTLRIMFYTSLSIPFVISYIAYAWRQMDKKGISEKEIKETGFKY